MAVPGIYTENDLGGDLDKLERCVDGVDSITRVMDSTLALISMGIQLDPSVTTEDHQARVRGLVEKYVHTLEGMRGSLLSVIAQAGIEIDLDETADDSTKLLDAAPMLAAPAVEPILDPATNQDARIDSPFDYWTNLRAPVSLPHELPKGGVALLVKDQSVVINGNELVLNGKHKTVALNALIQAREQGIDFFARGAVEELLGAEYVAAAFGVELRKLATEFSETFDVDLYEQTGKVSGAKYRLNPALVPIAHDALDAAQITPPILPKV